MTTPYPSEPHDNQEQAPLQAPWEGTLEPLDPGKWTDADPDAQEAMEQGFRNDRPDVHIVGGEGYAAGAPGDPTPPQYAQTNCYTCHAIVEDRYLTLHFKWHRTLKHKRGKK